MLKRIFFKLKLIFIPSKENNYRPKFLDSKFLTYYLIVLLVLKLIVTPFFIYFPKSAFFAALTKTSLITLTNEERITLGIQALKENPKLEEAAYLKAKDIIEKDYFAHQSPEGISPWYWFKKTGYDYKFAGENLAIGFLDSEEVYRAWLDSPSHKRNLLDPNYSEIGIAVLRGDFQGNETTVVVQLLGTPQSLPVKVEPEAKKEIGEKEILPEEKEVSLEEREILSEKEEIISPEISSQGKDMVAFNLSRFISVSYHDLIKKITYVSLGLVILSLLIVIFFDIFIYYRFSIQYKDLVFKAIGFSLLLVIFLLVDKVKIIQLIPHNFSIY